MSLLHLFTSNSNFRFSSSQAANNTELEQRVEILEVEVNFLTDEVEEIEVDVNQVDDRVTLLEETVIGKYCLHLDFSKGNEREVM